MTQITVADLQSRFGSENFSFYTIEGGLIALRICNSFGEATLALHGAHVMTYQPAGAAPVLWMSEKSMYQANEPIRGGIPVCWPWFGPDPEGKFGAHGYARVSDWNVIDAQHTPAGKSTVTLELTEKDVDVKFAPQEFKLQLTVTLVLLSMLTVEYLLRKIRMRFSPGLQTKF